MIFLPQNKKERGPGEKCDYDSQYADKVFNMTHIMYLLVRLCQVITLDLSFSFISHVVKTERVEQKEETCSDI